jgi:AraC-like DNA-binding protein
MQAPDFEFYHYLDQAPPRVEYHYHEFYEVLFFISGSVNYMVEGRSYQLRPGDILLTDNRDIHRPEVAPGRPYERYVLWLNGAFLQQAARPGDDLTACFRDAAERKYKLIRPDDHILSRMKLLCERLLRTQRDEGFGSTTLLYAGVTEFLVHLNRAYFDTPAAIRMDVTESDTINRMVEYIETHLVEDLSLDRLAEVSHLSKFYLDRQFKQFTGLTIYQFIIKKRLIIARNMLREGTPVMEACLSCGFNDYSNFLKAFKREFGRTPREVVAEG